MGRKARRNGQADEHGGRGWSEHLIKIFFERSSESARKERAAVGKRPICVTGMVSLWLRPMASITLKDIPVELRAQLKNEAAANFRSITQEAMSRLERTFQIDAALTTKRDQKWIDEAMASGPEKGNGCHPRPGLAGQKVSLLDGRTVL